MSGIFGIYHADDQPINPSHLQGMANSIAHRGPDRTKTIQKDHIGLGHSMLQTTPESLYEHLPFNDPESGMVITADARIDNREKLITKLGLKNISGLADSQLILYAYQKWGLESFERLIGDFSFVIWDFHTQQLICVRDFIGIKPFYYHHSPQQFLFSSEIKQLAEHPDVTLAINEGMVGEYLCFSFCSRTETLFADINRLAPGHYLIINRDTIRINKYWPWKPGKRIWYKKTSDYTEHFLEIFQEAVNCRLRSNRIISAELSGGLDSSTVVGMASKLLQQNNRDTLQTYSLTFPGKPFDEKAHIDAVIAHTDISANFIPYNNSILPDYKEEFTKTFEPPNFPNLSMNDPLLSAVKQNGSRVILSGIGGDECFGGAGYPYMDYLQNRNLIGFLHEIRFQWKQSREQAIKRLGISLSWPLILPSIRALLVRSSAHNHIPEWLSKDFITNNHLIKRIQQSDYRLFLSNLGNLTQRIAVFEAGEQFFLETIDRQRAAKNIENRYPFLDQRVIEFAMSVPDYINYQQGQTKLLLRSQSNIFLPQKIQKRNDKADFSYLFNQIFLHSLPPSDSRQLPLAKTGWIHEEKLNRAIVNKQTLLSKNPYSSGHKTWELWFAFSMNLWYKELKIK